MAISRVNRVHLALHMAWVRRGQPPAWACRLLHRLGSTFSCGVTPWDELRPEVRQALEANAAARRDRELRALFADERRERAAMFEGDGSANVQPIHVRLEKR